MDEALAASRYGHGMLVRYKKRGQLLPALKRLPIASLFFLALAYGSDGSQADDLPTFPPVRPPALVGLTPQGDGTSGLVPCPDCKATGKVSCPTCDGKGEIYKPCEICRGNGLKPCPVCSKEAKVQGSLGPGKLTCSYCGGKGTVGVNGKLCFHCGGEKTLPCDVCGGKGTVPCIKQVYESVCPACHFVKKITCPTCGGALSVSPQVLAARKRIPERSTTNGERKDGKKPEEGASPSAAGEPSGDLSLRYRRLNGIHDIHLDIFATDLRPKMETFRSDLTKLQGQLREGGITSQSQLAKDLDVLVKRLNNFQRRWDELRKAFDQEHKTYITVRSTLDSGDKARSESPRRLSEEEEEKLTRRLDLALKIAEKNANLLVREDPDWLSRELVAFGALTTAIKKRGEAELVKVAQAAAVKASSGPSKKAQAAPAGPIGKTAKAKLNERVARSEEDARDPSSPQLAQVEALDETGEGGEASEAPAVARAALPSKKAAARLKSGRNGPQSDPDEKPSRSIPAVWGLFGFAAAILLLAAISQLRKKTLKPAVDEEP